MATKIYIVKGTYENYSYTECVIEGVYSDKEKAIARYNLLVNEVKTRINDGELDDMELSDVHENNTIQANAKGEKTEVWYTYVDYADLRDTFEIEVMWLNDEEPENEGVKDIPGFEETMQDLANLKI